jgi:hypothetical protein
MTDAQLDQLSINTIRTLSIDAVQQAKSGHPGTPMALAPLVYTLWNRVNDIVFLQGGVPSEESLDGQTSLLVGHHSGRQGETRHLTETNGDAERTTAWLGISDSNSEMSSQIIPLKGRIDLRDPAEFSPQRLFAFELRHWGYAARA